jgi:hypothetical protein
MTSRKFALAMVASASILTACGDSQLLQASLPTAEDFYIVFALTGTPAAYPSGINTYVRSPVRVDGNASFDIAFDLDASGKVLIYPVQKIVSSLPSTRRVGLRRVSQPFDSVDIAPSGTYADSVLTVGIGEAVVVQSSRNSAGDICSFDLSPYIYSKLVIDSVAVPTRTILAHTIVDPNCGFKQFTTGIPTK